MTKKIRTKISGLLVAALAFGACDVLDVSNPNNLVEESIRATAAAAAVVNGSEALVYSAISQIWQPYLVASDDLYWIGSRDAWLSLDQGNLSNPDNEFTDGAFPSLGRARWMADEAVDIIDNHVTEGNPVDGVATLQARANLYAGLIYMIIGEVQEDFAFSDKTVAAPPLGSSNMQSVFDQAISKLDAALAAAPSGDDDLRFQILATRARAKHSRAVWGKIRPSVSGSPLVNDAGAVADAEDALDLAAGGSTDAYQATYSSSTITNSMASWVNDRKENNVDPGVATIAGNVGVPDSITVTITDPIDGGEDPVARARVLGFRQDGAQYLPLDIANAALMELILAEAALADGDNAEFTTRINNTRGGQTAFSGQIADQDMLEHARRVNTLFMGLRLSDMYRWGIADGLWQGTSVAMQDPGIRLPITSVELLSNCYLNGTC